jgi:hypothetical protein
MPIGKDHILDEIKRTAAENGDTPLGEMRFRKTTGIKKHDWCGVYWIRWSDALAEAGYKPNKFGPAYDKVDLVQKYAALARELDTLPTEAHLRRRGRTDIGFPHPETFRRFGSKLRLVQEVAAYCRERIGFESVSRACDAYLSLPKQRPSNGSETVVAKADVGFVYLMKFGRFYKIGHSNAAGRREYELAIQLPGKLTTVHTIRTDDPVGIEAYWHNRFKDKRKNGEWFELTAPDISAFKRRKFM